MKKNSKRVTDGPFQFLWFRNSGVSVRDDLVEPGQEPISYGPFGFRSTGKHGLMVDPLEPRPVGAILCSPRMRFGPHYFPLEQTPLLHREFAELDGPEDIESFCASYGFLGRHCHSFSEIGAEKACFWGESVEVWRSQAMRMREVLRVFDSASGRQGRVSLEEMVEPNGPRGPEFRRKRIAGVDLRDLWPSTVQSATFHAGPPRFELVEAAMFLVRDQVNRELDAGAAPFVTMHASDPVYIVPRDLRAALYCMFAAEAAGELRARRLCRCGCGQWFTPTQGKNFYVEDSHKSRAERERKKALRKDGKNERN